MPRSASERLIEVRRVRPQEYDAAGRLTTEVYDRGGFVPAGTAYSSKLGDVRHRAEHGETYVAVEQGLVLGVVTFCPVGSPYREIAQGDDDAEFRMLAVAEEARGRGVGTALVEHCLARAREVAARRMVNWTMSQMRPAHRLYEGLGFVRLPALDLRERDLHLLTYVLELTERPAGPGRPVADMTLPPAARGYVLPAAGSNEWCGAQASLAEVERAPSSSSSRSRPGPSPAIRRTRPTISLTVASSSTCSEMNQFNSGRASRSPAFSVAR